jgi:hypothetical protein
MDLATFLREISRVVRPLLWSGAKTLRKESLRTGDKILTDIADKALGASTHDIVSRKM